MATRAVPASMKVNHDRNMVAERGQALLAHVVHLVQRGDEAESG